MTKIEIPDDIAPLLEAKAAAEGLMLTEWIKRLVTEIKNERQGESNNTASLKP